jgi:hypothetical protein
MLGWHFPSVPVAPHGCVTLHVHMQWCEHCLSLSKTTERSLTVCVEAVVRSLGLTHLVQAGSNDVIGLHIFACAKGNHERRDKLVHLNVLHFGAFSLRVVAMLHGRDRVSQHSAEYLRPKCVQRHR